MRAREGLKGNEANHTTSVQHITEVLTASKGSGIIIAHTLRRQSPVVATLRTVTGTQTGVLGPKVVFLQ